MPRLRISISDGASIWPAVTAPGPVARRVMRLGPSECMRRASCLMLRTMSTTSSRTPSIEENSWTTPSIWMAVTAAPCRLESSTRRRELPRVTPKPRSSGSATMRALRAGSAPISIAGFSGRMSSFQLRSITGDGPRRRMNEAARRWGGRPTMAGRAPNIGKRAGLRPAGAWAGGSRYAGSASRREWR